MSALGHWFPVPPLPIDARQSTARARALSEMVDKAANDSAKCQSSGAALGSQAVGIVERLPHPPTPQAVQLLDKRPLPPAASRISTFVRLLIFSLTITVA